MVVFATSVFLASKRKLNFCLKWNPSFNLSLDLFLQGFQHAAEEKPICQIDVHTKHQMSCCLGWTLIFALDWPQYQQSGGFFLK